MMCALMKILGILIIGGIVVVINVLNLRSERQKAQTIRCEKEVRELEKFLGELEHLRKTALDMLDRCKKFSDRSYDNAELEELMRNLWFKDVWWSGFHMCNDCIRSKAYYEVLNIEEEIDSVDDLSLEFWNLMTINARKYFINGADKKMEDINKCVIDYCGRIEEISMKVKERYSCVLEVR